MIVGIPREQAFDEKRVGLSPAALHTLVQQGQDVLVERGAGLGSGYADQQYISAGARLVANAEEVFQRSDLLVKVSGLTTAESEMTRSGQTLMGFTNLHSCPKRIVEQLCEKGCSVLDYSSMQDADGLLPVLTPMSQIAGRMVPQIAARYLQSDNGGSGILLGGLPAVPPAEVVILGGGTVGRNAARAFLGAGARITLLDDDLEHLRELHWLFEGKITTYIANDFNLPKVLGYADVIVGAVRDPKGRTPRIVTREMVVGLRDGSVIIDLSIDQGGCFDTSRPTRPGDPIYIVDGVTHFCVPNLPSLVARTATAALGNATASLVCHIAREGLQKAALSDPILGNGVVIYEGGITDSRIGSVHDMSCSGLGALLGDRSGE